MSGMFTPDYGKTIRLLKAGKLYQGIFVGAGPYLTASTNLAIDPSLLANWSGASNSIPTKRSCISTTLRRVRPLFPSQEDTETLWVAEGAEVEEWGRQ
jgi:hypothetical protein